MGLPLLESSHAPRRRLWVFLSLALALLHPGDAFAGTRQELIRFQGSIIDRRAKLNPRFKKVVRKKTEYIIVHTSEGGLSGTLRVVSKGKVVNRKRVTPGGHAHYVIAQNGTTYRTLDKRYVADHAGTSLWDGVSGVSTISVGIELVGNHYTEITRQQYRSLELLLDLLQKVYGLEDRQVLTHSQVAYGEPNRWIPEDHRGRKRCAQNLDRSRAGLGATWAFDPDVRSGRLTADAELSGIYYGPGEAASEEGPVKTIGEGKTAWTLAGPDYMEQTTIYIFPDGTTKTGRQISDWHDLPSGTRLIVGYRGPYQFDRDRRPPGIAGDRYDDRDTVYLFPDNTFCTGNRIGDFNSLPDEVSVFLSTDES